MIDLEVGSKPFKAILKYNYYGHLELREMDVKEVIDILTLVDMYNIHNLASKITAHLKHVLSLNNVCNILEASQLLGFDSLTETCFVLLDRRASSFLLHEDFTTLSQVNMNIFSQFKSI